VWSILNSDRLKRWQYKFKYLFVFEICLIGLASAIAAVLLKEGVNALGGWRLHLASQYPAWLVLPGVGLIGGFLSGWLVQSFAPSTAGSGIPQVKAYLAGVSIDMTLRVAVVKLVGGILALGSGLTLGREGPTVQMSVALAAQLSRRLSQSYDLRRQIIAAGAGAGLSAAFNAPIAGVLFVVEELRKDASSFTFGTAILASFVGAVVARELGAHSLDIDFAEKAVHTNFSAQEIPFYLLLGVLAGLFGCLFNRSVIASLTFYQRKLSLSLPVRVGIAGLVTGIIVAFLPVSFWNHAGMQEILESGGINWQLALSIFVLQFLLTMIGYGSGAPGGLFAPTLTLGASMGHLVGQCAQVFLGIDWQVTYALVGMGALLCGVIRAPITAIAIIFEMTQDFNLVLPLMIGSLVAYFVAERISPGSLYDRLLQWNGIVLSPPIASLRTSLTNLKAKDVMSFPVETLNSHMTMAGVIEVFAESHHRGFPVVDDRHNLVGIITQKDLNEFLWQHNQSTIIVGPEYVMLSEVMTRSPITVSIEAPLLDIISILNKYELSRLPVMDGEKLVGLITRTDLIRAEAKCLKED
jgi:chloride channel protein, CIC family